MATQAAIAFIQKTCRGGDGKSPNGPTAHRVNTLVKVVGRFEMRPSSANVRKVLESCFIRLTSCSPVRDAASRDGQVSQIPDCFAPFRAPNSTLSRFLQRGREPVAPE